ncbi:MAG: amidohydrolase family protein [Kibdelosporangium sp.]
MSGVGLAGLSSTTASAATDITVLTGATLIDGTGTPARRDTTIVLSGDRIIWTGQHIPKFDGVHVIDLRGKYVIPGLWDMHTHIANDTVMSIPLCIANGVTSVREMWGFPFIHEVRGRIDRGEILGPRFTIASGLIDGADSARAPASIVVTTAAEARVTVRQEKSGGADFIKVYPYLARDSFLALVDEAKEVGLKVCGHAPARLSMREVSEAGFHSVEHLYNMSMAVSSREAEFLKELRETPVDPQFPFGYLLRMLELDMTASLTYNRSKALSLYERFARNRTWQSPTLSVVRMYSSPAGTFANDPRLKYIHPSTRTIWAAQMAGAAPTTPEEIAKHKAHIEFRFRLVGEMERAGVPIIGGTDVNNPYVIPGFAAHDELELLVRAGLAPMRALQTMTRDAAEFLGLARTMGTVSAGKVADLVVLERNPLTDIRNTQTIHSIITRGKVITPEQRAKILADVEAAAGTSAPPAVQPACGCHSYSPVLPSANSRAMSR